MSVDITAAPLVEAEQLRGEHGLTEEQRAACRRCRRPGRPTSRPARCSTGSARSTASPSRRRPTRPAARWCTRCWSGCSTCRPPSAPWPPAAGHGRAAVGAAAGGAAPACRAVRRRRRRRRTSWRRPPACSTATSPSRIPRRLEPAERECLVEAVVDDQLLIRGYIDRLDVSPDRRPAGGRLQDRRRPARGVRGAGPVPAQVLRAGAVAHPGRGAARRCACSTSRTPRPATTRPTPEELTRFERKLVALWRAIDTGHRGARLPAQAQPALRLVQPPGAVPGVRRHPPPFPRARARAPPSRPSPSSSWRSEPRRRPWRSEGILPAAGAGSPRDDGCDRGAAHRLASWPWQPGGGPTRVCARAGRCSPTPCWPRDCSCTGNGLLGVLPAEVTPGECGRLARPQRGLCCRRGDPRRWPWVAMARRWRRSRRPVAAGRAASRDDRAASSCSPTPPPPTCRSGSPPRPSCCCGCR